MKYEQVASTPKRLVSVYHNAILCVGKELVKNWQVIASNI